MGKIEIIDDPLGTGMGEEGLSNVQISKAEPSTLTDSTFGKESLALLSEDGSKDLKHKPVTVTNGLSKVLKETQTKKITITIDNSIEDIIDLNSKGIKLIFDSTPGRFLKLPVEVVKSLSQENLASYAIARACADQLIEEQEYPPSNELSITPNFADPMSQMTVEGLDESFHYCFFRRDQIEFYERFGYVKAADKELICFNKTNGGVPIIGTAGKAEMVLMKIPKPMYDRMMEKNDALNAFRNEGVEENAKEAIGNLGGKVREIPRNPEPVKFIFGDDNDDSE